MNGLIDRLVLMLCCLAVYMTAELSVYMIVPLMIATIVSTVFIFVGQSTIQIGLMLLYIAACFFYDPLMYFLPFLSYQFYCTSSSYVSVFAVAPFVFHYASFSPQILVGLSLLFGIGFLLKKHVADYIAMKHNFEILREIADDDAVVFEKKNKNLIELRENERQMAMLAERGRIAREIHDNVGHLLSRGLLQLGAVMVLSKEHTSQESLENLKTTLVAAMENIRSSVHAMVKDVVHLRDETTKTVEAFSFCPVHLQMNMDEFVDTSIKIAFLAIVKEALSNVAKHSNATRVTIHIQEQPALYQLIVHDNGTHITRNQNEGIGLKNMMTRISTLHGQCNVFTENGFRIFVSVPKTNREGVTDDSSDC